MAQFQLFIDDSGTREYDPARNYTTSGRSRYFVYGAILLEQRDGSLFVTRLRELKRVTFGTADVEIKSNWLRIGTERKNRYLEGYRVADSQLTQFTDDYYTLLVNAPLKLLGAVVDKLHMQERYGAKAWYAPTVAYEVLLQRAVQAVGLQDALSVTVDDIGGKTPKHHAYKDLLAEHHRSLVVRGSRLQKSISFSCLRDSVRFMNSEHSDLLQAADLVSYNVYRQFRDYGDEWERGDTPRTLPTYPYFNRIAGKFHTDANGRVQGFGIVKFPLINRVVWRLTP
jgi:hypothetical protein